MILPEDGSLSQDRDIYVITKLFDTAHTISHRIYRFYFPKGARVHTESFLIYRRCEKSRVRDKG
jgi:hypothetical protein